MKSTKEYKGRLKGYGVSLGAPRKEQVPDVGSQVHLVEHPKLSNKEIRWRQEGIEAYDAEPERNGVDLCPYEFGTHASACWFRGWKSARRDARTKAWMKEKDEKRKKDAAEMSAVLARLKKQRSKATSAAVKLYKKAKMDGRM